MAEGKWQKYDCAAVDTYSSSLHGLQAESDSKLDSCFGIISGFIISFIHGGLELFLEGLSGMVLPVVILYPVFMIGAIGAGDLKLFAVVGSYLGIKGIIISFIFAFISGAIISLVKMIRFRNFKERIYYFFSYMADIYLKGKWRLYEETKGQVSNKDLAEEDSLIFPTYKIHFALPIFLGVVIYIGGIL